MVNKTSLWNVFSIWSQTWTKRLSDKGKITIIQVGSALFYVFYGLFFHLVLFESWKTAGWSARGWKVYKISGFAKWPLLTVSLPWNCFMGEKKTTFQSLCRKWARKHNKYYHTVVITASCWQYVSLGPISIQNVNGASFYRDSLNKIWEKRASCEKISWSSLLSFLL